MSLIILHMKTLIASKSNGKGNGEKKQDQTCWLPRDDLNGKSLEEADTLIASRASVSASGTKTTAEELATSNGVFAKQVCAATDRFAKIIGRMCQHQSDRRLSHACFPDGMLSCSKKTADEESLVLCLILLAVCSRHGLDHLNVEFDGKHTVQTRSMNFVEIPSEFLCRENFLHQHSAFLGDLKLFEKHNPHFMSWFLKVQNRTTGSGSCHLKAHLPIHCAWSSIHIGLPEAFNSRIVEAGHISVKAAARSTQKRVKALDMQTARADCERQITDRACRDSISPPIEETRNMEAAELMPVAMAKHPTNRPKKHLGKKFVLNRDGLFLVQKSKTKEPLPATWPNRILQHHIVDYLQNNVLPNLRSGSSLHLCNSLSWIGDDGDAVIFHSNPNKNWHDWACIKWDDDKWVDEDKDELLCNTDVMPGRILAMFEVEPSDTLPNCPMKTALSKSSFHCVTTKCVENYFVRPASSPIFKEKHPLSGDYLARPEQDMVWFSIAHEKTIDVPSEVVDLEKTGEVIVKNKVGPTVRVKVSKLHTVPANSVIHQCLAVPHDLGHDFLTKKECKNQRHMRFCHEEWMFVTPKTILSWMFPQTMQQRIDDYKQKKRKRQKRRRN